MSTATHVPETSLYAPEELSADDAARTLRQVGRRRLARDSFMRFRYGDGFSHARALGFQFTLSFIPLVIAVVGLSTMVSAEREAGALRHALLQLSPGTSADAIKQALERGLTSDRDGGALALTLGLLTALVALTTSMGQIERGANRIYGIQRDRPARQKYARAALLAVCAGVPSMLGFLLLVAGGPVLDSLAAVYGWGHGTQAVADVLRWPLGAGLDLVAITAIFHWAPRRNQPAFSWVTFGAGIALALWLVLTGLLALYVRSSSSFGQVYGPLTGIIALLLWSQLTSVALFFGIAFGAQLEAVRAGQPVPMAADPMLATGARTSPVVVLAPDRRDDSPLSEREPLQLARDLVDAARDALPG